MSIVAKRREDYQAPAFLISHTAMTFDLDATQTKVTTTLSVQRNGSHKEPLVLDGEGVTLKSLAVNGIEYEDFSVSDSNLTLNIELDQFELCLQTEINPAENKALEGLYLSNGVFCTQCEAEGFRRITYYLDRPDVLAEFTVTVIGDLIEQPSLLSNGNPVATGKSEDGRHWVRWHDPHPKPCYLFALVAGDFDLLTDQFTTASGRDVKLELYVDKGKANRGPFALESLKRAMKWDEEVFGLEYDLDIYMVVAVDFFNMGAMENKGLNIFNSKFVLANPQTATDEDFFNVESVIAHEYFHNWTGNRVTCRDWFQLSLKEGLTVFRDQQFSADMSSPLSNRIKMVRIMREHQFAEDASAMSHPIRPDEVIEMNNFYTVTVYDKGAEVIRMLHTLLGEKAFRQGMDEYFRRHDGQAVTCDDFVAALQSATSIDLTQFSRWYSQSGTPVISLDTEYEASLGQAKVSIRQHTPPTAGQAEKHPLMIPLHLECFTETGEKISLSTSNDGVLVLDSDVTTIELSNLKSKPIIALPGNFSAPVKVDQIKSTGEYLATFKYANDAFLRWDAVMQLYDRCIEVVLNEGIDSLPSGLWQSLAEAIESEQHNAELLGECLAIPSIEALLIQREEVAPLALTNARNAFIAAFATHLKAPLITLFKANQSAEYDYNSIDVSRRRCKNQALLLLANLPECNELISEQYRCSDNMTDSLGALKAAQVTSGPLFDELMADFEQQWQHDPLVLDKWFALHASTEREDILAQLTMLQQHPCFTQDNPNRMRAVMGTFGFYNTAGFHAADGSGYRYLTDYLLQIDGVNPQVASRLVTPLMQFQVFDKTTQERMKSQLARLLNHPSLSKDVFEKVSKSLAFDEHVQ